MSREARSRVILGVGIPLTAFLFLALLIFAFSRILLAVPDTLAPWIALLFATNILIGCALAAMIPGTRGFSFLISVLVATIVIGGVVGLVVGERPVHSLIAEGEHPVAEEAAENAPAMGDQPGAAEECPDQETGGGQPGGPPVTIAAKGLAFDTAELSLPDCAPVSISFSNEDQGIPHNVAIYTAQGGEQLFQGEIVTGPAQIGYEVPALDPGEYFFQCDVHPTTMTGSVTVG